MNNLNSRLQSLKRLLSDDFVCGSEEGPLYRKGPPVTQVKIEPGKYSVCFGEVLTPSLFYCCVYDSKDTFETYLHEFYETYGDYFAVSTNLPVGSKCAALYSKDLVWYRALVLQVDDSSALLRHKVHFLDYGNVDWIPMKDIRRLDAGMALHPCQIFLCGLTGILPADMTWSSKDFDLFLHFAMSVQHFLIEVLDPTSLGITEPLPYYPVRLLNPKLEGDSIVNGGAAHIDLYLWMSDNLATYEATAPNSIHFLDSEYKKMSDHLKKLKTLWAVKPPDIPKSLQTTETMPRAIAAVPNNDIAKLTQNLKTTVISSIQKPVPKMSSTHRPSDRCIPSSKHTTLTKRNSLPVTNSTSINSNVYPLIDLPSKPSSNAKEFSLPTDSFCDQKKNVLHIVNENGDNGSIGSVGAADARLSSAFKPLRVNPSVESEIKQPSWFPEVKPKKLRDQPSDTDSICSRSKTKKLRKRHSPQDIFSEPPLNGKTNVILSNSASKNWVVPPKIEDSQRSPVADDPSILAFGGELSSLSLLLDDKLSPPAAGPSKSQIPFVPRAVEAILKRSEKEESQQTQDKSLAELEPLCEEDIDIEGCDLGSESGSDRCFSPLPLSVRPPEIKFYPDGSMLKSSIEELSNISIPQPPFKALVSSSISTPDKFYINIITQNEVELFSWMEKAIAEHYTAMSCTIMRKFYDDLIPSSGWLCCVELEKSFYRAVLLTSSTEPEFGSGQGPLRRRLPATTGNPNLASLCPEISDVAHSSDEISSSWWKCLLLDYGDEVTVCTDSLHPLSPQFRSIPALALQCRLVDLVPIDNGSLTATWPKDAVSKFNAMLEKVSHKVTIDIPETAYNLQDGTEWVSSPLGVYLYADDASMELLNVSLVKAGLACPTGVLASALLPPSQSAETKEAGITDARADAYTRAQMDQAGRRERDRYEEIMHRKRTPVCEHFRVKGRCAYGKQCKYRHVEDSDSEEEDMKDDVGRQVLLVDEAMDTPELPQIGSIIGVLPTCLYSDMRFYGQLLHGPSGYDNPTGLKEDEGYGGSDKGLQNLQTLRELNDAVNNHYQTENPLVGIRRIDYLTEERVAAKFNDGLFYRAQVRDHDQDTAEVEVFFEDFGNTATVPEEHVFPLLEPFATQMLPRAVEFVLSGISPTTKGWTRQALQVAKKRLIDRIVHAQVIDIYPDGQVLVEVYNYITHLEDEVSHVSLNEELILLKYAKRIPVPTKATKNVPSSGRKVILLPG